MAIAMDLDGSTDTQPGGALRMLDHALERFRQHQVIGLLLTLWGWAMVIFPRFMFRGDLFEFSPSLATAYAQLFVIAGVYLATHRPIRRREAFLSLVPLLAHLLLNVWRILVLVVDTRLTGGSPAVFDEIPTAIMFGLFIVFISLWIDKFDIQVEVADDGNRGV